MQGPLGMIFGFCFGVVWGLLIRYVPNRHDVSNTLYIKCAEQCLSHVLLFHVYEHCYEISFSCVSIAEDSSFLGYYLLLNFKYLSTFCGIVFFSSLVPKLGPFTLEIKAS
jgi:hypothetical protein